MLRGVNRQNIFEDDEDRAYFMNVLRRCKDLSRFRLHAFALMSNHVHLLIEPGDESLETIFRRIGTRYALWFNWKYERVGHLFQNRYISENVETDLYFMTVLRYILRNPMKAGLETRPGTYRWSSWPAYQKGAGAITDTEYATALFGGRETLVQYLLQENEDEVMDEENFVWRLRDDAAKEIILRITQCGSVAAFQKLDSDTQKEYARKLYQERLSMGQIARLTGMSKPTVFRAIRKQQPDDTEDTIPVFRESSFPW